MRERAVAVAFRRLGLVDAFVHIERTSGEPRQPLDEPSAALGEPVAVDESRRRDRARVDERVGGAASAVLEADGVERLAAGLDAHAREHLLAAVRLEREGEDERLRDRLDREQDAVIAHRCRAAARADDGERERVGVGAGKLGNVVSDLAGILLAHLVEQAAEHLADRIHAPTLARPRRLPLPRTGSLSG